VYWYTLIAPTITACAAASVARRIFFIIAAGQAGQRGGYFFPQRLKVFVGYRRFGYRDEPEAVAEVLRVGPEDLAEPPLHAVPGYGPADAPPAYYAQQPPFPGDGEAVDDEGLPRRGPTFADRPREVPPAPHTRGARKPETSFAAADQRLLIP
jgi:hypothetical protein